MIDDILRAPAAPRQTHDRLAADAHRVARASASDPENATPPTAEVQPGREGLADAPGDQRALDLARDVADSLLRQAAHDAQIRLIRLEDELLGRLIDEFV